MFHHRRDRPARKHSASEFCDVSDLGKKFHGKDTARNSKRSHLCAERLDWVAVAAVSRPERTRQQFYFFPQIHLMTKVRLGTPHRIHRHSSPVSHPRVLFLSVILPFKSRGHWATPKIINHLASYPRTPQTWLFFFKRALLPP
jgi:hypothetical protein